MSAAFFIGLMLVLLGAGFDADPTGALILFGLALMITSRL